jgi:hypothetical protein
MIVTETAFLTFSAFELGEAFPLWHTDLAEKPNVFEDT